MKRVVIIDDDDIFLFLCSKALQNVGYTEEVKKFTNSQQGLEYLLEASNENYPTMLMIDINMPLVNGWEIVETLEQKKPDIFDRCKVFILSSSIDNRDKEKAMSYKNVAGFVIKPVSEAYLINLAKEQYGLG